MASGPTIKVRSKDGPFWMGDPGDGVPAVENAPRLVKGYYDYLSDALIETINDKGWGGMMRRIRTLSAEVSCGWFMGEGEDATEVKFFGGTHIYQPEKPDEYDVFPHDWRSWTIVLKGFQDIGVGYAARLAARAHLFTDDPDSLLAITSSIRIGNKKSRRISELGAVCLGPDPSYPNDRLKYVTVNPYKTDKYFDGVSNSDSKLYDLTAERMAAVRDSGETMLAAIAKAREKGIIPLRGAIVG